MKSRTIKNDKDIKDICEKYNNGNWTMKLLAEKYHCSSYVVKNILQDNGVEIKTHTRRFNLNFLDHYFENIDTEDKAYFLGLLLTDGNVHIIKKSGLYQISLELCVKDKDILDKFKKVVNSESKVSYRKRENTEMVCVRFYSEIMAKDLSKYGIIPNKTKKLKHLPILSKELMKHFIRGMIDGDGSIYQSCGKYNHVTFCSYSYNVCNELQKICDGFIKEPNLAKILKDKGKEIYRVHYNDQTKVKQLVTVLYKDSNYYLARKYALAKNIFEDKNEEDIV